MEAAIYRQTLWAVYCLNFPQQLKAPPLCTPDRPWFQSLTRISICTFFYTHTYVYAEIFSKQLLMVLVFKVVQIGAFLFAFFKQCLQGSRGAALAITNEILKDELPFLGCSISAGART